jgi:hypothetical protein
MLIDGVMASCVGANGWCKWLVQVVGRLQDLHDGIIAEHLKYAAEYGDLVDENH